MHLFLLKQTLIIRKSFSSHTWILHGLFDFMLVIVVLFLGFNFFNICSVEVLFLIEVQDVTMTEY
uniref:Putative ovule protein n=1 Tax=Solanum chacoense TaxID=4108 RepID=A0A0V0I6L7_SOLCH